MKKIGILIVLCISLLLSGCGILGGRYTSVTPHREQQKEAQKEVANAANNAELIRILEDMIQEGAETGVIYLADYPEGHVEKGMKSAVEYVMETYSLGAYAVESISYEVGTTGSLPAMAVTFTYRHSDVEMRQIREIMVMEEAESLVAAALEHLDSRLVMRVKLYLETDFQQMVRSYAETYPDTVMEIPQVTVGIYGTGADRVVELSFAYQTSRDSLRQMHAQVKPVFSAAELYVSGDGAQRQKYSQLYGFLMERFDYQVETSITPAYSLLHHGVGDSRAFATVYAAMCRRAGLDCLVVTGTRSGEPWVWNMVLVGETYQHVDLLRCSTEGRFQERPDREMEGYVWDYSAYPECPVIRVQEQPQPEETKTIETEPAESVTVPQETEAEQAVEEKIE